MRREEAIRLCKYYGKDQKYTDPDVYMFIKSEEIFVEAITSENFPLEDIELYKDSGLVQFKSNDGVPMALKAIMYKVFMHTYETSSTNQFKIIYNKY